MTSAIRSAQNDCNNSEAEAEIVAVDIVMICENACGFSVECSRYTDSYVAL